MDGEGSNLKVTNVMFKVPSITLPVIPGSKHKDLDDGNKTSSQKMTLSKSPVGSFSNLPNTNSGRNITARKQEKKKKSSVRQKTNVKFETFKEEPTLEGRMSSVASSKRKSITFCSTTKRDSQRRESMGESLRGSRHRRASRGSVVDPRGILSHMLDPLAASDINLGNRVSVLKNAHEDLAHANEMKCRRTNGMSTFEFVKTNLLSTVDIVDASERRTAELRDGPVGFTDAILQSNSMQRPSVFFHRQSICREMNSTDSKFRRDTMVLAREENKNRPKKHFGILSGGTQKAKYRQSIARDRRTSQYFAGDKNNIDEEKEKLTFKGLVQAIIRARRWNVPLYMGHADEEVDKDHATSPMDFDLNRFKCDSHQTCPPKAKYAMTLDPWERTDQDIDVILRVVQRLKCFEKYSIAVKRELARVIMFEAYGNGRIILQQGHPGFSMYFILQGCCSVQLNAVDHKTGEHYHQIVGEIQAGSCFGELALVKDITRTATVVCKGDSEFLRLDRSDFDNVLRRSMENEWNSRLNQLQTIPYFGLWPMKEIREINIHAQIKDFKPDEVVIGNRARNSFPEHVYFITKGRCNLVRRIAMVERSRVVGTHSRSQRILKYRRIPGHRVNELVGDSSVDAGKETGAALKTLNDILSSKNNHHDDGGGGMTLSKIRSNLCRHTGRETVKGGYRDYNQEGPKETLIGLISNSAKPVSHNNQKLMAHKTRQTHHAVRSTCGPSMRHGYNVNLGRNSTNTEGVQSKKATETKIIYKYLIVGKLEVGDSFGFGENLANVFIVTATSTDFLTIPGHIMMRAERHVETFNRNSQIVNMTQLSKQLQREQPPDSRPQTPTDAMTQHKSLKPKKSSTHHYEELRQQLEDKIPSERESFDRWRQSEDWKAYKGSVLANVIQDKENNQ